MGAGASLKKVETLLEDIKQLPVNKFTEEMRELQVKFICLLTISESFAQWDLHSVLPFDNTTDFLCEPHGRARHFPYYFPCPVALLLRLMRLMGRDYFLTHFCYLGSSSANRKPVVDTYERNEARWDSVSPR
jgi:hypothetical protein